MLRSETSTRIVINRRFLSDAALFDTMVRMAEQAAGRPAQLGAGGAQPEAWRRTELARHPDRPYPMDFIEALFTDFSEIHGDRALRRRPCDGLWDGPVSWAAGAGGCEPEGTDAEGARGAEIRLARSGGLSQGVAGDADCGEVWPACFTFLDLAGANPGIGAEERGQGEAIARNLLEMARLRVPTIATVTGEGGRAGHWRLRLLTASDAGERDLYGDLAGGLRVDHVEGREQETAGGCGAEVYGGARRTGLC